MSETPDPPADRSALYGGPRPERAARPRDAATLILWRSAGGRLEVLMGVRSVRHRFMPNRLVFPGGRVDLEDRTAPIASDLHPATRRALELRAPSRLARAIAVAAARELHEETGLLLGHEEGGRLRADLAPMRYLCRAVTPPASPVRFNARFLLAPAEAVTGSLAGSGELEHLAYYPIDESPPHELAPITGRVLHDFRDLMALPEEERDGYPIIWYQGQNNRRPERGR